MCNSVTMILLHCVLICNDETMTSFIAKCTDNWAGGQNFKGRKPEDSAQGSSLVDVEAQREIAWRLASRHMLRKLKLYLHYFI